MGAMTFAHLISMLTWRHNKGEKKKNCICDFSFLSKATTTCKVELISQRCVKLSYYAVQVVTWN